MPELLIFAYDHPQEDPNLSPAQVAALPSVFDLIDVKPDGGTWGKLELAHPWFRVLVWPQADEAELEALCSSLPAQRDANGLATTLFQYRSHFLNGADPGVLAVPELAAFWNDTTRTDPKFFVPADFAMTVAQLTIARAPIPDPAYPGTNPVATPAVLASG